jgi:hypothetical protein
LSNATITANESASRIVANATARRGLIRPAATGREAVLGPISRSMSRSITWLNALAPPHASPPPITSALSAPSDGAPPAAATIAHTAVRTSSDMIRGLVSVT